MDTVRQRVIGIGLPLLFFTLMAVFLTWPLASDLTGTAPGLGHADAYMMLRQAWAAREALLDGHNPMTHTLVAYPEDFTSYMMWSTPLRWVPTMLLMWLVPPITAYNLWLLAVLILNGLAAYRLGLEMTGGNRWASLIGGLVFASYPTQQGHMVVGHLDVLSMYTLPLFALCLWRVLFKGAGWRTVAWGGVWLALASLGLTSQLIYHVLPVAGFLGLYALVTARHTLVSPGAAWTAQPLVRALGMMLWGGVLLLPFFGPLMTSAGKAEIDDLHESGRIVFSTDLLAVVSPSPYGLWGRLGLAPDYARDVLAANSTEGSAYVGIFTFVLVAVALLARGRERRKMARAWLFVALGALLLSLGPLLKWRDEPVVVHTEDVESYVTLPWVLVQNLPVIEATRTTGRINGATSLAVAMLAALGADAALCAVLSRVGGRPDQGPPNLGSQRTDRARWLVSAGLTAVVGTLILLDTVLFLPYPTGPADQGPYFDQLAAEDDVRAVFSVPYGNMLTIMPALYQQTIHEKAMIAGQLYRHSPQDPAKLHLLERAVTGGEYGALPAISAEMTRWLLSEAGADRVVLYKKYFASPDAVLSHARDVLGEPEYEDDTIMAFAVPRVDQLPAGADLTWAWGDGWTAMARLDGGEMTGGSFDAPYMGAQGVWYVYAPGEQTVSLAFNAASLGLARRVGVWLDDQLVAAQWIELADRVTLTLRLEKGYHTLRLEALDGCDEYRFPVARPDGTSSPLGSGYPACISVAIGEPEWAALDPAPTATAITLDQGVTLRGYAQAVTGGTCAERGVSLRLFWTADHALSASYALFVHVSDPATDVPLAQYDNFPLVTTDHWDGGAVWTSNVWIPLGAEVPAGEYTLNAGWFDPEQQERLGVQGDDRWAAAGMVHLGALTVPGCE